MKFIVDQYSFEAKLNKFPSGEIGVVLPEGLPLFTTRIKIQYNWPEYKDTGVMVLAQLVQALKQKYMAQNYTMILDLPYVPYSRQDRVCNKGESFSLKVFTDFINSMEFDVVNTWDNHSDVATALINNCVNISQVNCIRSIPSLLSLIKEELTVLVSPDAGAIKKTRAIAKAFDKSSVLQCDKERDIQTGRITSVSLLNPELLNDTSTYLVVDDICDGGGTFLGIAKAIRQQEENATIVLYVTHGFFTQGLEKLLDEYTFIFTTTSVCTLNNQRLLTK